MPMTNEQLYSQIAALDVTNKEFRDATLTMLGKLVRSNELSISGRESFRQTVGISATAPIILDFRDRKHVYLFSTISLTLTLEDMGTLAVAANTWVDISFRPGLYIYAQNQVSIAYVTIAQTDETISSSASASSGGTQYTDGNTPPANPTGNSIIFDNSGAWVDVGNDAPMPVTVFGLPQLPAGTNNIGSVTVANANANGQATMTGSSPVTFASNQTPLVAGTGTKASVASSAASVTILASNVNRKGATFYNDSTQVLYLDLSGGTAASNSYSVQVPTQGYFELLPQPIYTGAITGIWAAANGSVRVTEFS